MWDLSIQSVGNLCSPSQNSSIEGEPSATPTLADETLGGDDIIDIDLSDGFTAEQEQLFRRQPIMSGGFIYTIQNHCLQDYFSFVPVAMEVPVGWVFPTSAKEGFLMTAVSSHCRLSYCRCV